MRKESCIVHENGDFWVLRDARGFHVMSAGVTHSAADSSYASADLAKRAAANR